MKEIKQTIVINRPVGEVFDFTINPANTSRWVDGVVTEETNEIPTTVGTIYRNQGDDGEWREFEITAFDPGVMFEMTKKDDDHHIQYTFKPLSDTCCELEYYVWTDGDKLRGAFNEPNIENILKKLKSVTEDV